ncbi:MAG: hypothetical protein ACRDWY_17775 [Actinomycetes bacterium]
MDRALPAEEFPIPEMDPLADETRLSALLLGGALGVMGLVAAVLLLLTTRFGG